MVYFIPPAKCRGNALYPSSWYFEVPILVISWQRCKVFSDTLKRQLFFCLMTEQSLRNTMVTVFFIKVCSIGSFLKGAIYRLLTRRAFIYQMFFFLYLKLSSIAIFTSTYQVRRDISTPLAFLSISSE